MNKTYTQQTQKERKQKELDSVSDTLFFRTIPPFLRNFENSTPPSLYRMGVLTMS